MLWNVKQVAEYLCLSKSKVYLMASNGEIPYIKFGDSIRFRADEIDNFINDNKVVKNDRHKSVLFHDSNLCFNSQYMS